MELKLFCDNVLGSSILLSDSDKWKCEHSVAREITLFLFQDIV